MWPRTSRIVAVLLALALVLGAVAPATPVLAKRVADAEEDVDPKLAAMQARAEAVFGRLAEALAPQHDVLGQYTIEVVRERVPNAWINQNNEIYVSTGLMELLTTDDQLAGVIGHEIAHGTLGHIPHRVNQSLWSAFIVLALGVVSSANGEADWGGLLHMRDLFMFAYSREQESEADLEGLRYAQAAGYDPEGLLQALQLMDRDRRRLPEDSVWQQLYRTHPPIPQRVSDLRFVLTTERLSRAPLAAATFASKRGAESAEAAAITFARAWLAGDAATVESLVAADTTVEAGHGLSQMSDGVLSDVFHESWLTADAEIVRRRQGAVGQPFSFDETLTVWFSGVEAHAGRDDRSEAQEAQAVLVDVTVRRSAAGWFVTGWEFVGELAD